MAFWDDNRGQAIQIGAVLLFAVLVIAFSLFQAFVVPNQNKKVEFNHNTKVQSDLQDLRNEIHSTVGGNPGTGVAVQLGTTYPSRLIALNPPPASGRLRTIGTTDSQVDVAIVNATANGETGDVWNGSARRYNTGGILYTPDYNEYPSPPQTVYENSLLYNQFTDETLSITDQSLISGDRISIVALNGSFDRSGSHSMTVDPKTISESERTISVKNGSGPITLNITTRLTPDRWRALLSDQANVKTADIRLAPDTGAVPDPFRRVLIPLKGGVDYTLRMTKVGIGTGTTAESPAYLTDVAGDGGELVQGQNHRIVLEVRDPYNNPQSGIRVYSNVTGSGSRSLEPMNATSDGDGRVAFTYTTTDATTTGRHEIQFSLDPIDPNNGSFDGGSGRNVSVNVTVTEREHGGGSNTTYDLNWYRPPFQSGIIAQSLATATTPRGTPFTARATDNGQPVAYATIDYALSNGSVARVVPTEGETDTSGYNDTTVVWRSDGRTRIYVNSAGAGDVTNYTFDRLLFDRFEGPTLASNGWYYADNGNGGGGGIRDIGSDADSGTQVAYINGTSNGASAGTRALRMNYTVDTTEHDTLTITYVAREDNTGSIDDPDVLGTPNSAPSENLRLQYYASDDSWVTIDNVTSTTDDPSNLPRSYYRRVLIQNVKNVSHQNFELRFVQGETTADDEWQIDTLAVTGVSNETVASLNGQPFAAYRYSPSSPSVGETVTFDAARSDDPDDNITTYEWDWDDDGNYESMGETSTHSFSTTGTHQVTLRVTDERGAIETARQEVNVTAGVQGSQIQFVNGSAGLLNNEAPAPTFEIENVGTDNATINQIRITTNATNPDHIYEQNGGSGAGQHEVFINSNDHGYLETGDGNGANNNGYSLGTTVSLTDEAVLTGGEQATVTLYRFYQQTGGKSGPVDVTGSQVTVTFTLGDSSSTTFSFVVPNS